MTLFEQSIPVFIQMLRALSGQLDKGTAFAEANGGSGDDLLDARLAPDMHPLSKQVYITCEQATLAVKRLTGKEFGEVSEDASTVADLKIHIDKVLAFLSELKQTDVNVADDEILTLDLPNGMVFDMTAAQYVRDWALSQFYFHLVAAYSILRHKGVELGKADYVSYMFTYMRKDG